MVSCCSFLMILNWSWFLFPCFTFRLPEGFLSAASRLFSGDLDVLSRCHFSDVLNWSLFPFSLSANLPPPSPAVLFSRQRWDYFRRTFCFRLLLFDVPELDSEERWKLLGFRVVIPSIFFAMPFRVLYALWLLQFFAIPMPPEELRGGKSKFKKSKKKIHSTP